MQKYILGLVILIGLFVSSAQAKGEFGAGIILGSPTGFTGKLWQDRQVAYDMGFAFSTGDYFLGYADYLVHYPGSIRQKNQFVSELMPYIGFGGIFVVTTSDRGSSDKLFGRKSGSFGMGVRVPMGLEWKPGNPTIGVFVELAPGVSIAPATDIIIMGGFGIRYYF